MGGPWPHWPPPARRGRRQSLGRAHGLMDTPSQGLAAAVPTSRNREAPRLVRPGTTGALGCGRVPPACQGRNAGPLGQRCPWPGLALPRPPHLHLLPCGRRSTALPAKRQHPPPPTTAKRGPCWFRHSDPAGVVWRRSWGHAHPPPNSNSTHTSTNMGNREFPRQTAEAEQLNAAPGRGHAGEWRQGPRTEASQNGSQRPSSGLRPWLTTRSLTGFRRNTQTQTRGSHGVCTLAPPQPSLALVPSSASRDLEPLAHQEPGLTAPTMCQGPRGEQSTTENRSDAAPRPLPAPPHPH